VILVLEISVQLRHKHLLKRPWAIDQMLKKSAQARLNFARSDHSKN
jgi:hypothetical protein